MPELPHLHRLPDGLVLVDARLAAAVEGRRAVRGDADPLPGAGAEAAARRLSPTGKVPLLVHRPRRRGGKGLGFARDRRVSRRHLSGKRVCGRRTRWRAPSPDRSAAEMHSGFRALREHLPMALLERHPKPIDDPDARADIARVAEIWRQARDNGVATEGGPWLFGHYTVADGMYAPIVTPLPHLRRGTRSDLRGLYGSRARRHRFPRVGSRRRGRAGARAADRLISSTPLAKRRRPGCRGSRYRRSEIFNRRSHCFLQIILYVYTLRPRYYLWKWPHAGSSGVFESRRLRTGGASEDFLARRSGDRTPC